MYAGTDFRWERPIRQDDRVVGESVLHALIEKPSKFAKRAIQQIYRTTFTNQHGERVCEADSWCFRTERETARERGKFKSEGPHRYSEAEIAAIRQSYATEKIRGATPRRWDDVTVGEAMPEVVRIAATSTPMAISSTPGGPTT